MSINVPKSLEHCPEGGEHRWSLATGDTTPIVIDCGDCGHIFADALEDILELDIFPLPLVLESVGLVPEEPVYVVQPHPNP